MDISNLTDVDALPYCVRMYRVISECSPCTRTSVRKWPCRIQGTAVHERYVYSVNMVLRLYSTSDVKATLYGEAYVSFHRSEHHSTHHAHGRSRTARSTFPYYSFPSSYTVTVYRYTSLKSCHGQAEKRGLGDNVERHDPCIGDEKRLDAFRTRYGRGYHDLRET